MATNVTICNKALRRISEGRINNLDSPFNNHVEQNLADIYPDALREALSSGAFRFAIKTRELGALDVDSELYDYVYGKPSDCLKPLHLIDPGDPDNSRIPFEETDQGLETNESPAILRYVKLVTDPNLFDPLFESALAWRIAAEIASVLEKPDKAQLAWNGYRAELMAASGVSSNTARKKPSYGTSPMTARRS